MPVEGAVKVASCHACLQSPEGPSCRSAVGQACEAPVLSGPHDEVQRLLDALSLSLASEGGSSGIGLVRGLRVEPGEVELALAVDPHCRGAALADTAFQTLRALLPDTDIYVTHAA
ncbi:MAG: hypothetical protein HY855_07625 [Burkholderiales bacterium]|nr:hypothetical protein [Burkholderiales bacterium]